MIGMKKWFNSDRFKAVEDRVIAGVITSIITIIILKLLG